LVEELDRFESKKSSFKVQNHVMVTSKFQNVIQRFRMLTKNRIPTGASESEALKGLLSSLISVVLQQIIPLSVRDWFSSNQVKSTSPVQYSAYQIPMFMSKLRFDTPDFYTCLRSLIGTQSTEIHYWVPNDETTIKRLVQLGADAVITDRTDTAVQVLRKLALYQAPRWSERVQAMKGATASMIDVIEHEETHTCTSLPCMIIENYVFLLLGLLFMSLVCGYQCVCYPLLHGIKQKKD
jgi:hypothetical protein